jgi:hypothetical protein
MTAADLRRAMALCRAAGHTTVPVPIPLLAKMLGQMERPSRGLAATAVATDVLATHMAVDDRDHP